MATDNKSAHLSSNYDQEVVKTIPYYAAIHDETINFIRAYNRHPVNWLDTGCGTGTLASKICDNFQVSELVLADPSSEMLKIAESKLSEKQAIRFVNSDTMSLSLENNHFQVITAIQSHHYLHMVDRERTTKRCFDLLQSGGVFITFENTRPLTDSCIGIANNYWSQFQTAQGKAIDQVQKHFDRFDTEYFPITVDQHINLYTRTGFKVIDIFWKSYMQAGFYCIKQ
ncbi:MAG TPA: class I SAM-dependent methyltransferase [Chitinispirillaceae bacterium]|nr:class I SAM-dependent methyltransferase [Chitinispirillaceae bacterium]